MTSINRRTLLRSGLVGAGAMSFGTAFWRSALAADPAKPGPSPYGELAASFDASGLKLPAGFTSRIVAIGGDQVGTTGYIFPPAPDGAATYATSTDGWIFAVNSEVGGGGGGVSAIRFAKDGSIESAQRVLGGTSLNCSGGKTPWRTWLSGEEVEDGAVWECDPRNPAAARKVPSLGIFKHEAVAVDDVEGRVYLTEDIADGNFYRFTPDAYPNLDTGTLEAAIVAVDGSVTWGKVPRPLGGIADPTRKQVPGATIFPRGEGIWMDSGVVYVVTTIDKKVHAYDTKTRKIDVVFDGIATPDAPLKDPDNVCASHLSGDLFVCEDSPTPKVAIITPDRIVARFADMDNVGIHAGSEATGPAFTPDGSRLLFSSQRAFGGKGAVIEIRGPFRTTRPGPTPTVTATATPIATASPAPTAQPTPTPRPQTDFGVTAARQMTFSTARKRGITVRFTTGRAYKVTAVLKARVRRNGKLKTVTIGRVTRNVDAGPETMVIKLNATGRSVLKDRKTSLTTTLEVTIGTVKTTRTVRLKPPARKKSSS